MCALRWNNLFFYISTVKGQGLTCQELLLRSALQESPTQLNGTGGLN